MSNIEIYISRESESKIVKTKMISTDYGGRLAGFAVASDCSKTVCIQMINAAQYNTHSLIVLRLVHVVVI